MLLTSYSRAQARTRATMRQNQHQPGEKKNRRRGHCLRLLVSNSQDWPPRNFSHQPQDPTHSDTRLMLYTEYEQWQSPRSDVSRIQIRAWRECLFSVHLWNKGWSHGPMNSTDGWLQEICIENYWKLASSTTSGMRFDIHFTWNGRGFVNKKRCYGMGGYI